jgi:hypothetical protein
MSIKDTILEYIEQDDEFINHELNLMVKIIEFISTLSDDALDDESYDLIGEAYESLLDVIISLEDDELDDESSMALKRLFIDIESLEEEGVEEAAYKPRKIKAGRAKSSASRMTGSEKQKYIKRLKARKKKYKTSATARMKAKKVGRKYKKSAAGKQTKRIYKHLNK